MKKTFVKYFQNNTYLQTILYLYLETNLCLYIKNLVLINPTYSKAKTQIPDAGYHNKLQRK